ncbi:50S ribosomal protein L34e [Candidatus Woesearchaeota archaeon]|nr:50S ribosomal protein L34e [Candidatus Woesearchaeota archaeon]
MPIPQLKSRTFRRVQRRTPGGKTVQHYHLRKPKQPHCGGCGAILHGIPHERPVIMRNIPKTMKRPERPYGGVLCSKCMRVAIVFKARQG